MGIHTQLGYSGLFCVGDQAEFVGIRGRREWPNGPNQCPSTLDSFRPINKSYSQKESQRENSAVRYVSQQARLPIASSAP